MAQTTSDSILGWSGRNPGFFITEIFVTIHSFQWGIKETADKPKMVLPPSEQHCLGGGMRALTAF